ncbi:serine hydrolase, partial [Actinoplanes sp. NPDC051633]|uniref:serine hydrolase n=1 Tax=Actinoplanes sp. NPDC051633 TaxID=3155670 RepID=UPI0034191272
VDTLYDLASVTTLIPSVVLLQLVAEGRVDLDAPVATHVPEFAAGGKAAITPRNLLNHNSGLPAFRPFYSSYPTPETRLAAALATPVAAGTTPGAQYVYSDIGLIALGVLIQRVTGKPLDVAVRERVTGPLSMRDTLYRPGPELRDRIAATEFQPYVGRGMVWGEVHDENAWSLGGVAGHAGLFSTAGDLAIFCQMLLNGGRYRGHRILSEAMVRQALVNYNFDIELQFPDSDRGLGFELNKHLYMDAMASPVTFGHTGFTGTSLVIDPLSHSFLIILANRVHPDRGWGTNTAARRAIARSFADAHPVRPVFGGTAWRTERRDNATVTLTAPLRRAAGANAYASFLLWYDTEPRSDSALIETSADGGATWAPLPATLRSAGHRFTTDGSLTGYGGRRWWQVTAALPAGATTVRWSYRTDAGLQGRGIYVDHLLAVDPRGPLFTAGDPWTPDGWRESTS